MHEIDNVNGKDSVFVVGEPAWHKLGTVLPALATSAEAIKAANLDWSVSKVAIQTVNGQPIPDKYAVVRDVDQKPLGVVGNVWNPVQNSKAFDFFDAVVGGGQAIYETAGALKGGRIVWIMAKLSGSNITVVRGDEVEKRLLFVNSHDGSRAVTMHFTPVRVVCANTLRQADNSRSAEGVSIRHCESVENKVQEARSALKIAIKYYDTVGDQMRFLSTKSITKALYQDYLKNVFPNNEGAKNMTRIDNIRGEVEKRLDSPANSLPGVRGTFWSAYNSVTEFTDHKALKGMEIKDNSRRLESIWLGNGAKVKERAWNVAMEMATVN